MGVGRRKLARLWALALALACAQHSGWAQHGSSEPSDKRLHLPRVPQGPGGDSLLGVTILPPLRTTPVVRALNPAHNGRVCSTWGDFHYKTFDGDVFRFPGRCNYVFSAHCGAAYEDFNVQLRRGPEANTTAPSRVTMKLNGMVLELTKGSVLVNGHPTQLPFSQSGVLVEHSASYLKVVARLGLVFMWNQDDSLLLELDTKYANQTCGLCGDFNGVPVFSEFLSHDVKLTPVEFGNLQKMDGPMEQCQDPAPAPPTNCSISSGLCEELLMGERFLGCHPLVDASSFVQACQQDLCLCEHADFSRCVCHTLAEYSRQCAHAGGLPLDWRGPGLCPRTCPHNMQYRECGSPCADTCSNLEHSQLCEDHCVAGCFCPEGMVLDDIGQTGCVPVSQCPCVYSGATYAPGAVYSTDCTNCTCSGGRWGCQEVPCPGTCTVLGGAHFSTFDEKLYTVHGDCSYVLAKPCDSSAFTVLAELRKCGLTDSETCLRSLTLSLGGGRTVVVVKASGEVFVNQIYTQLPVSAANVTVFRPSTFFIVAQTPLGLQVDVQLVPTMQVFLRLAPELRGLTCGLCGNFNQNQADDFLTLSGVVEGTAAAFANTWKTQAACPNVKNSFEDPCSLSVENEKYAQHWCSQLTDPEGPFAQCHATVSPGSYYSNCLFDTCNCERSEDCLCAALSAYVRACAAKGVLLSGWRAGVCTKPMDTCPKSMTYHYHISTCQPTCQALSSEDPTCSISFVPVDGCTCPHGTFLDNTGKCVPATRCPCYHGGSVVPNGESVHESGAVCTCTQGTLTCIGGHTPNPACAPPMVYVDCRNATPGDAGAGCQKSCHTLDMDCYSPQCVPGCVCPDGLVADGEGGCIDAAHCPCVHNEASYPAGQTIRVGCNTCTCKSRMWQCTGRPCLATCAVYGDGHYLTFDGQRYSFNGDCEYTLVQDHCGGNGSAQDAFRVVTENVPCGTTGTTCSKAIKIFLGGYELKLSDGQVEVIEKGAGQEAPYSIRQVGIYLVVDTEAGLVLLWDKKTSIFLRLSPEFKGKVCGLCGNFDDNAVNDFTTRSQSVVGDALEFGNSWKFSPTCPDAPAPRDPCIANPYRKSWAQKQCSLINSPTFAACHAHVEPAKYYEACVSDACACDSGGDCECFCTAVAAYAQACREAGACVSWRTPSICPLFCDYYNPEGQCEWHYQPCGAPCMRTCQNPSGQCLHDTRGLEGCYPKCPPEAPIFDEDNMQCVATCPSPPPPPPCQVQGKSYRPGAVVPSDENCHSCICTESGVECTYDAKACVCTYDGRHFRPGDVIYNTTDGTGGCISARCGAGGTVERTVHACRASTAAPSTTFYFSTPPAVVSSTRPPGPHPRPTTSPASTGTAPRPWPSTASAPPTPDCGEDCQWSPWLDVSRPGRGIDSGDFDTLDNLRAHGFQVCQAPRAVECRAEDIPEVPLQVLGQRVECSPRVGLTCYNRDQVSGLCDNYQIRVQCCTPRACPTSHGPAQTTPPATSRTTNTGPVPGSTSVLTGSTASPAPVTTTGPTTSSTTSKTPAPGTSTPVPGTTAPVPDTPTPAPGTTAPVPGTTAPVPGTPTPAPGTTAPVPGTTAPVPGTPTPAPGTTAPVPGTTAPVPGTPTPVPGTTAPVPGTTTPVPDTPTPAPGTTAPVPGTTAPVPGTPTPAPGTTAPVPGTTAPVPGTTTPVPDTPTPAPGTTAPVPGTTAPVPGTTAPVPGTLTPVPDTPTPAPGTTAPVPGTSTTVTTTLSTPSPMPVSTTTSTTTSVSTTAPGPTEVPGEPTSPQPSAISCLQEWCSWTEWIDGSYPEASINSGDFDTFQNLRSKGYKFCERPNNVECRAERFPSTPLVELGQDVVCNRSLGLLCLNKDQLPPICYNYQIRIQCCEWVDVCRERTTPPVTSEVTHPTPHRTKPQTQATWTTGIPSTSTQHRTVSSVHVPPTTKIIPSTHVITPPGTTNCQRQCTWTKWFDVDFPSPGPHGGDLETYSNIVESGEKICRRPEYITHLECRAENHPEVSIDELGQVVQCSPDVGLVCHNRDQLGKFKMCFNYEVRVLCCEPREGCPTFEPVTVPSTPSVSITSPTETTSHVATSRTTSVPETSTTSVHKIQTTSVPGTSTTSVHKIQTTSVPETSTTSVHKIQTTSVPETSTTSVHKIQTTSVPETSTTSVSKTSTTSAPITTTTPVPVPETTHPTPRTTNCQRQCTWTKWFDVDFPSPGPHGGDLETYSNIVQSGEKICRRPEYITHLECRAENHPEVSIDELGQVVQCSPDVGLVCHNRDQLGKFKMCFNYEVRVLCCEPREGCPTFEPVTVPSTPSVSITSPTETTSHVATSRTTSVPETSTTSVHKIQTTSVPGTSTTSVHKIQTTSVPETSTTSVHKIQTTSVPETSTTSVHKIQTTSVPETSTTSVSKTSTTSAPITTTTPVPVPETTHPTPGTTNCQRQCTWTKWFDVDFPSPGPHGGDLETYSNIVQSGEKICRRPEYITHLECRAENHPEVSIDELGQVVQCSPDVGLVCHNRDQLGKFKMCFNYEVRVLCCEPREGCPTFEPVTVPSTPSVSITSPTETTSHVATSRTTSVPETSTTSVHKIQTTSVPETSTTSVHKIQTTSVPETSTTSVSKTSTTSAPITTTTPVPVPETTHPTPRTTNCQRQCTWTKWFDVDFPSPGPHGGDRETYSNIVKSGEKICRRPEYITHLECRAENHPEVSIDELGQVVQCSPDVGLVCHNRDQVGKFKMCLNYEVRVLCCEPQEGCPQTSVTPYVTSTKYLPTTESPFVVPTVTSPSSAVPSAPRCYCSVSDKLYPAGSIIYQQADLDGHCYYAVCSLDCHVVRQTDDTCPTSTPPPTPVTSPPGSSPSTPVPVTTPGCPNAVPPRTKGETWAMPNCSQATCEGNNVITLQPRPCPEVQVPTCANGYPAVKVADEDGCCLHYQCQCVCSGWGDPHYITFDGTYYTFLDNCTYVLVQQIVPVYGHLRVLIDNYFCGSQDGLSCPQSIVVEYRRERVVLTRKPVRGVMTNEIVFNNQVVSPGFAKGGVVVSQVGIKMYVTIPEIGVRVMFTGLLFSVEVPFSKFANNTEGQCGTCTNDLKDECRLPGGAVVASCSDMSGHWKVTNPDQPFCHGPPPTTPAIKPSAPPAPCPPSPICQLILSDVFELCHAVIPPMPYYQGCVFDHCHMTNADVVCSGLELYASLCVSHGVCIDWRGQTNNTCPFTCPADKVYRPCGPSNPSYCYEGDSASLMALQDAGPITEGCFCPEGMTLFSATKDVCVPTGCPRCLGPHGEPVESGHTVSVDCQECTCEASTWTMSCRRQPCPLPPACAEPGFMPVPAAPEAGQCCPQYTCACNTSHCPTLSCPEGTRQILTYEDEACCPSQICSWTVCSVNGTLYQPGAVVSSSLCETCRCEVPGGSQSDMFRISCETQTCNTHCPVGFEYQAQSGQCCGLCVQVACVMNTSDSSAHLFYPGESWSEPGNHCVTHECERHQDRLVVVTTKKACPPLSCPVDQARLSEDGCCLSCPQPQTQNRSTCAVYHKHQVIRLQGCSSPGPVRLAYCQGNCGDTTSMFSLEANALERTCRCCQELRAAPRTVTLRCADGSRRAFSLTQVEECGCVGRRCDAHDAPGGPGRAPEQAPPVA